MAALREGDAVRGEPLDRGSNLDLTFTDFLHRPEIEHGHASVLLDRL